MCVSLVLVEGMYSNLYVHRTWEMVLFAGTWTRILISPWQFRLVQEIVLLWHSHVMLRHRETYNSNKATHVTGFGRMRHWWKQLLVLYFYDSTVHQFL